MVEYTQSKEHDIHVRLRREPAEKTNGSVETIDCNGVESNLDGFQGCYYKKLHLYNKKKRHRKRGPQGDESNHTRDHFRRERTTGYPANYQSEFESEVTQSDPSIDLRLEHKPIRDAIPMRKYQPEIEYHKKVTKNKKSGKVLLHRNSLKAAEREIIGNSITTSSITPGITVTNSYNLFDILTSKNSHKSYSEWNFMQVKDKAVHLGLKKCRNASKISSKYLPQQYSKMKSRRRNFFWAYSTLLLLHNKRKFKPKSIKKDKVNNDEIKPIVRPEIRKKNKRKQYEFERDRQTKIHVSKVQENLSPYCTPGLMQNFCDQGEQSSTQCLSFSKPISTPYAKMVTVYSVYDQKPTKSKPAINLATKSSFNVKFYKSMGDGGQMFGDNSPSLQIPRNYSPTNMARAGRDEDGCICVCIPQYYDYRCMEARCNNGESFLKRYFRVLLKENKRHICVRRPRMPAPKPCPYANIRPNRCPGRMLMPSDYNVGCHCKHNNARRNFRANDVACQCKCKERRDPRLDDIYCKDRGTTCSVPALPDNECKSNPDAPNSRPQQGNRHKHGVNIGSNFSFQVGLYKRCIDNNPNPTTLPTNQTTFIEPKRDDYYFINVPANDPNLRYMEGDARYNIERGGVDCCCGASDVPVCYEPKPSVLSVLLSPRPRQMPCKSSGCSPYSSNETISPCSPPSPCCMSKTSSNRSSFLKQFERSDLCCNNKPKSRCKPKHKAVHCRCDKKPKVIGCIDSKKNVGTASNLSKVNLSASAASTSCKCYKVKNIGCLCSNEPILAECPKKKSCCSNCNVPSQKSSNPGRACSSTCNRPLSKKKRKSGPCCSNCNLPARETGSRCKCKKSKKQKRCCRYYKIKNRICCKCNKPKKKVDCCVCDGKSRSLFNIFHKDEECCCCNEWKFSLVRTFSMMLKKKRCNKCNLRKICKCKPKSGQFDYKNMINHLKKSSLLQKKVEVKECPCGKLDVKQVLSELLVPPEPKLQTRAQQCKCKEGFDIKRAFGRLLLFNTVQKEICCSRVTYDQNSRTVGTGEEDYRKLPPCRRYQDRSQGDGIALKKFVSKLIKPENSTKMHYSAFNPLNQCETGIQHSNRIGPDDRAGATVCRNQGSCVPKSKPLTVKDCDNATCPALQSVDPNRRAVRIGSSCSFSLEFYKGMPPSKSCPPPCPATCSQPCPAPCAVPTTPVCNPASRPCTQSKPFLQRAANYMLSSPPKSKPTCKKCDNCVKVPIIKRGFAHMILKDKKPLHAARTCQKTNTLQPNRKLVTRKPTAGKGLGASTKCDPYVCLKRINQRKCCK